MSNTEENVTLQSETNHVYEAGVHLLSNLSADEVSDHFANIKKAIEAGEGEVLSEEFPVRMSLAYPMERKLSNKKESYSQSYFGWVKFAGSSDLALEMLEALRENESILRSMVVKTQREDVFYHADEEPEEEEELSSENNQEEKTTEAIENSESEEELVK